MIEGMSHTGPPGRGNDRMRQVREALLRMMQGKQQGGPIEQGGLDQNFRSALDGQQDKFINMLNVPGPMNQGPEQARPGPTPYENPTQRQNLVSQRMGQRGIDPESAQRSQEAGRDRYASGKLGQFGQVAGLLGGKFQDAFNNRDQGDLAGSYRNLSGMFAQESQAQGVADPRELLKRLMMQMQQQGGRKPMLGMES